MNNKTISFFLVVIFGLISISLTGLISCGSGAIPFTVTTLAGSGETGNTDGSGTTAEFNQPDGVTVSSTGDVWMTDLGNHEVRHIAPDGTTTTVAGNGEAGYVDGPKEEAQFNNPDGIATDSHGNICVADSGNNVIRKITPEGEVSTAAGTGVPGIADGHAGEAQFNKPTGIAVDSSDNLYVADEGNNVIRKITPAGEVSTIAGTAVPGFQDGLASEAQFDTPHGIAIDSSNNLYVTDQGNERVRKISEEGEVTTIAGNGTAGYSDGPAAASEINTPHGVAVDSSTGEVFFADEDNNMIREIGPTGQVTTVAGTGEASFEDGDANKAKFKKPRGLALGLNKELLVCDFENNRIRKIEKNK